MNNFFLLNEAIDLYEIDKFKQGISELIAIEKSDEDSFLKHDSIWDLAIINELFANFGQLESIISSFLEQLSPIEEYLDSDAKFDSLYPLDGNAFLGIDFNNTSVSTIRQISDEECFKYFKIHYYSNLKLTEDKALYVLGYLFPDYIFENRAISDILYWNEKNFDLYQRLLELLNDIRINPFQGGLGKTEVLKNQSGTASKRLDGEHRITYTLKEKIITVLTCKGHYN